MGWERHIFLMEVPFPILSGGGDGQLPEKPSVRSFSPCVLQREAKSLIKSFKYMSLVGGVPNCGATRSRIKGKNPAASTQVKLRLRNYCLSSSKGQKRLEALSR